MRNWTRFVVLIVAGVMGLGCASNSPAATTRPVMASQAESSPRAYLLHLNGIGGFMWIDRELLAGMKQAGLDAQFDHYDWTCGDPGMDSLLAFDRNQKQADIVADRLTKFAHTHQQTKIYITSHSGGAGILAWALERCPDDVKVESVVFLAPALSPKYDLSKALKHVRGKAYVFYSSMDPVLGMGTKTFGTIDRVQTEAAGLIGFKEPAHADSEQYKKVVQMPYRDDYADFGNDGDHIGPMRSAFVEHVVAPLLGATVRETIPAGN